MVAEKADYSEKIMNTRQKALLMIQIVLSGITPVIILGVSDLDKLQLPYIPLFLWVLTVMFFIRLNRYSFADIGVRLDNIRESAAPYLVFAVTAFLLVSFYAYFLGRGFVDDIFSYWHLKFFFIPVSIFQELIYRGFMLTSLKRIFVHKWAVIMINSVFFVLLHIFFPNIGVTWPIVLIGALLFDVVYYRYPNLYLVSVVHVVMNFLTTGIEWM